MKLHEYQAKQIFASYGIRVPEGGWVKKPEEAYEVARKLGGEQFVVKAQVLAGGRGKAGGIKLCKNAEEVFKESQQMLGSRLRTHQTGAEGVVVNALLVERAVRIKRELYLSLTIDRSIELPVILASAQGGVEIEELAREKPEAILKLHFEPEIATSQFLGRKLAYRMGLTEKATGEYIALVGRLTKLFLEKDCSLVEINPLVLTEEETIIALDAKMNIDENALFRQKELASQRDTSEDTPQEAKAKDVGISYVHIGGSVGCMVNGAGLAMATMDLIKLAGGEPANFLDVGGGATAQQVEAAFNILLSDKNVRSVLVNIFGGIARCDVIAQGIIEAAKKVKINLPVIVRLEGTNAEIGRKMLAESGLKFETASSMKEAAEAAVKASSK
ncbi:MAG: ADP-forming succinate--CoA ligase subunit beta [Planctomycetota bacterium]|nr:ADP-forming succinate--CoA ligase subunit beta [Planctomycetota bacterium]